MAFNFYHLKVSPEGEHRRVSAQLTMVGWGYNVEQPEIAREILNQAKNYGSYIPYMLLIKLNESEALGGRKLTDMTLEEISQIDVSWRDEGILEAIKELDDIELGNFLKYFRAVFEGTRPQSGDSLNPSFSSHLYFQKDA